MDVVDEAGAAQAISDQVDPLLADADAELDPEQVCSCFSMRGVTPWFTRVHPSFQKKRAAAAADPSFG